MKINLRRSSAVPMSIEFSHECNNCGASPNRDVCWCEDCKDEMLTDAYQSGKEAGLEEGRKLTNTN